MAADTCQYQTGVDARGLAVHCDAPAVVGQFAFCAMHRAICVSSSRPIPVEPVKRKWLSTWAALRERDARNASRMEEA